MTTPPRPSRRNEFRELLYASVLLLLLLLV